MTRRDDRTFLEKNFDVDAAKAKGLYPLIGLLYCLGTVALFMVGIWLMFAIPAKICQLLFNR